MGWGEESPSGFHQSPAMGRRNVEVTNGETSKDRVELTLGVKTSKPEVAIKLSSCFCKDSEASYMAHRHGDDEQEDDSDNGCAKVEASQKDKGTAAAHTQMLNTKPKARMLVSCRQLIDGSEAASLRDQSPVPSLTLRGTVGFPGSDGKMASLFHASISGRDSRSGVQQEEASRFNRNPSNISRQESKSQYMKELSLQIEEKKQLMEQERRRNAAEEQKHIETMQHSIWGMPGSGAPSHINALRRTRNLHAAGILPQEQIQGRGFSWTPLHRQ